MSELEITIRNCCDLSAQLKSAEDRHKKARIEMHAVEERAELEAQAHRDDLDLYIKAALENIQTNKAARIGKASAEAGTALAELNKIKERYRKTRLRLEKLLPPKIATTTKEENEK